MINIAFLNQLAEARSQMEFSRIAIGFTALQIYDSIKTHGFDPFVHQDALQRIRSDIHAIETETLLHDALQSLIQAFPFWESSGPIRIGRQAVYTALLSYGQALGSDGEWEIANSVYSLVGMDTELDGETWLAAEARLLMGHAARMCADWETSGIAYRRAYELGMEAGGIAIALRARIGEANNCWSRGDFPAAKRILANTARRAKQSCPHVLPRVVLAMAGVENASGSYERAVHLAFGLLSQLPNDDDMKYKVLVDLAAFLTDYGLPSVAADTLHIVEMTAPEARVRRHARLNRFFLAAHHDDEATFMTLRLALASEPLTPRQQTQLALFTAQGYRRFSRFDAGQASAQRAVQLANQFELFQLAFEAEAELEAINSARQESTIVAGAAGTQTPKKGSAHDSSVRYRSTTGGKLSPRVQHAAESLETMARELATAGIGMSTTL